MEGAAGMHGAVVRNKGTECYRFLRAVTSTTSLAASDRLVFEATTTTEPIIRVAIKLYMIKGPYNEQSIRTAATSAQAAYQIASVVHHSAFPRVRELKDGVFVVMDWVNGLQLCSFTNEHRLSESETLSIGLQIAKACAALSRELTHNYPDTPDMGHGDLHFENVLIDTSSDGPTVRIVDFDHIGKRLPGVADWDNELVTQARRVGKLVVQPPEYILGSVRYLDSRADIFSLGAILYRLISGQSPFREPGGYIGRLRRLFDGNLHPDDDRCPFLHDDIENPKLRCLLTDMLRFNREIRIGSMDEVAEALRLIAH